jgi:hypothetical protein
MLREVVDRECVGGILCASARVGGVNFQACSIDHSDISPFRINDLRAAWTRIAQNPSSRTSDFTSRLLPITCGDAYASSRSNCVRPSNVDRSLTAIFRPHRLDQRRELGLWSSRTRTNAAGDLRRAYSQRLRRAACRSTAARANPQVVDDQRFASGQRCCSSFFSNSPAKRPRRTAAQVMHRHSAIRWRTPLACGAN